VVSSAEDSQFEKIIEPITPDVVSMSTINRMIMMFLIEMLFLTMGTPSFIVCIPLGEYPRTSMPASVLKI
jgi:hypothetical protein